MKIVYHHFADFKRELQDIKDDWYTCPPELICTKEEEEVIVTKWRNYVGDNAYIVDPLGHTQCLYVMLSDLPFSKIMKLFIEKEHKYDLVANE